MIARRAPNQNAARSLMSAFDLLRTLAAFEALMNVGVGRLTVVMAPMHK